jgi:hypothetical protein
MQDRLDIGGLRQQGLDPIALGTLTGDMTVGESFPDAMPPPGLVGLSSDPMVSGVSEGFDDDAGNLGGPFLDIFWPGWPPRLPTPSMLDHL